MLGHHALGNGVNLTRLGIVKCTRANVLVDFFRSEPAHLGYCERVFEQSLCGRQGHLIAGSDRDDTSDQLVEAELEPGFGQLKQSCLGIRVTRVADATVEGSNTQRPVLFRALRGARAGRTIPTSRSFTRHTSRTRHRSIS